MEEQECKSNCQLRKVQEDKRRNQQWIPGMLDPQEFQTDTGMNADATIDWPPFGVYVGIHFKFFL